MSTPGAATPPPDGAAPPPGAPVAPVEPLDECDLEPRTPMKRLGSTRKLAAFNNIRAQLAEQTRVLEARAEAAAGVAGELHDFCRRRAELEHEYARALDKLARAAAQRHKDQRHKREQWPLAGAFACWSAALEHARALSRDHAALAELYAGPLAARTQRAADDALRLSRRARELLHERHDELGAALLQAAARAKAAAAAAADWRAAAAKLRSAHTARQALQAADPPRPKKLKALDKELDKRRARHGEARGRALRARADYVLTLEAANATLQRYYLDDIADIMLCSEVGFEAVVGRALRGAGAAEGACAEAGRTAAAALVAAADALDALADRQRLVAAHPAVFALPRPLPYAGTPPPEQDRAMAELLGGAAPAADEHTAAHEADLRLRLAQLEASARALRAECREAAKTLDAAEAELVRQMEGPDAAWAPPPAGAPPPPPEDDAPRKDQEDYYLAKFRCYVSCAGRLARLESKAQAVRERLLGGGAAAATGAGGARSPPSPPRRAAAGRRRGHFAAPLDDRLPAVLTSCVRVIATYGLHQQGIFRVSGSQTETAALRAAFERGCDPLAGARDASDMHAVCGLLKLYLRELRPPLLPPQLQERLLRAAALPDDAQFARRLRDTLAALPAPQLIVLRYLFAFLAHLAEHAHRNMMDAWNLAICLGPTLLAAWGEGGAQVAAQNLVNELVKRTIEHHLEVFPQDIAPHTLYRRPDPAPPPPTPPPTDDADETDAPPDAEDEPRDLSLYDDDDDDDEEEEGDDDERSASDADAAPEAAAAAAAASPAARRRAAHADSRLDSTPDLVLDLPDAAPDAPDAAPDALAADTFAHNRDTLRKRPALAAHRKTCSEGGAGGAEGGAESGAERGAGGADGSPVPARNTLRVAAKFAELTLTGGSLKPALAAKPALLRRPTPHPHHPHAHPPHPPRASSAPAPAPADLI